MSAKKHKAKKGIGSRIFTIVIILIFMIGLAIMLYPTVSSYLNLRHQSEAIVDYSSRVDSIDEQTREMLLQEARDYNDRLYRTEGSFFKPERVEGYEDVLNVDGTDVIAVLTIPTLNVSLPICRGTSDRTLDNALGHMHGTSLPVGGENTHSVIAGHRGLPTSRLLTDLDKMNIGDRFTVTVLDQNFVYEVDQILVVDPGDVDALMIIPGEDHVTLLTCTPYGINTHRLLVRGNRVPDEAAEPAEIITYEETVNGYINKNHNIALASAAVLIVIFAIVALRRKKKEADKLKKGGYEE